MVDLGYYSGFSVNIGEQEALKGSVCTNPGYHSDFRHRLANCTPEYITKPKKHFFFAAELFTTYKPQNKCAADGR